MDGLKADGDPAPTDLPNGTGTAGSCVRNGYQRAL